MNTDYHQIASKLNYSTLEKKLEQMRTQTPPKTRKHVADVLAPIADRVLELLANGWTYAQLAQELSDTGLPVKASTLRRHFGRTAKRRNKRIVSGI